MGRRGTYSGWEAVDEQHGRAEVFGASDGDEPEAWNTAGILWLPDPETRHGWREYYIKRPKPGAASRGMGFATPRGRREA